MIRFSPSEDQQMMISLVKQFAADEMRGIYRQCDEKGFATFEGMGIV